MGLIFNLEKSSLVTPFLEMKRSLYVLKSVLSEPFIPSPPTSELLGGHPPASPRVMLNTVRRDTEVRLLSTVVYTQNRLPFWMLACLPTWCQDTLEDRTSFSHTRVTVSPSKMISGVTKNLVSSGNPKKTISRVPKQVKATTTTHQTPLHSVLRRLPQHLICGAL